MSTDKYRRVAHEFASYLTLLTKSGFTAAQTKTIITLHHEAFPYYADLHLLAPYVMSTQGLDLALRPFQNDDEFDAAMRKAVAHLKPAEAQRRIFLAVSITFHCIADTCRASQSTTTGSNLHNSAALFQQIVLTIEGLLGASAQD